jgi:hypothetical protein
VGGRRQAAIEHAFTAQPAHRRRVVVSVRQSTVASAWAAVSSVTPATGGRSIGSASTLTPLLSYYREIRGGERAAAPPKAVRADLSSDFAVAVVYRGSGSETIAYDQSYRSVCAGADPFTDQETDAVRPMSWTIRYVVNLDDLLAAVRTADGTSLAPNVTFDAADSTMNAVENLSQTVQDAGCNAPAATFTCAMTFHPGGSDPGGRLSFSPAGMDVGIPMVSTTSGSCGAANFTLGPSLWDGGAGTAVVRGLGLAGGSLPANPYAPIQVAWPGASAPQTAGFAASPCQGDASDCTDRFTWHGTVALAPVPSR